MTLPRWDSVAALYCLQKSMMLTPCGPRAVPTGGAGVAAPAFSCTLTTAAIFFFLGAIDLIFLVSGGFGFGAAGSGQRFSDFADLIERKLHRRLATEDRHEHLELLGDRVDLAHRSRKRGERPVHHGNGLVDLEVHRRRAHRLGLLRRLLLRDRREQRHYLAKRQRRGLA